MAEDRGDHVRGEFYNKFCAQAAIPKCGDCYHNEDYREACKPNPAWETHKRLVRYTEKPWETKPYGHEAHHILCVASINKKIGNRTHIRRVVEATEWCINGAVNMIAMPLWGHTIQHYCDLDTGKFYEALGPGGYFATVLEPPFKNIPMHNFGHPGYQEEVETTLTQIANKIAKSQEAHTTKVEKIKAALDQASGDFKGKLIARGMRKDGTHMGWHIGLNNRSSSSGWYEPFSMEESPRPITFPARGSMAGEMGAKLDKLVEAFGWPG
jgi:A nuclease family of the HNH/ENDO VII superfamily with conserved AHH